MSNQRMGFTWTLTAAGAIAAAGCTTSETVSLADYGVHEVHLQPAGEGLATVDVLLFPEWGAGPCLGLDHDVLVATLDGRPLDLVQEAREETLPRAGAICHHAIYRSTQPLGDAAILVVEDRSHRIVFELRDPFPEPTVTPLYDGPVAPGDTVELAWTPARPRIELDDGFPLLTGPGHEPATLAVAAAWDDANTMAFAVPQDAALGFQEIWLQGLGHPEVITCDGVDRCRASTWFDLALPLEVVTAR